MPIEDLVDVSISLSSPPLGLLDFAVPLVAAVLTTDQATAFGSARTRTVTPETWQTVMASLGVTSSEDLYLALLALFTPDERPSRALIGRRLTPIAQVTTLSIPASPSSVTYVVTINGDVAASVDGTGLTQAQLRDAIDTAVDASTQAPNVTATTGSGTVILTSDVPGVPFTVSLSGTGLTQAATTANVGLPEDLVAWVAEDNGFYCLLETTRTPGNIRALAAAVEVLGPTNPKLYIAQNDDDVANTSGTTDIGALLHDLGYTRTSVVAHGNDDEFVDAALVGTNLSAAPGSRSWSNKELTGVVGTVYADTTNLTAKNYTYLERFPAATVSLSRWARVAYGTPIDLIIARDFVRNLIRIRGLELLRDNDLGYDEEGRDTLELWLLGVLATCANDPYRILDPDTIQTDLPAAAEQSSTDRGNRHFPGVRWSGVLRGKIESLAVSGVMTV
jgi:hypothetical protein